MGFSDDDETALDRALAGHAPTQRDRFVQHARRFLGPTRTFTACSTRAPNAPAPTGSSTTPGCPAHAFQLQHPYRAMDFLDDCRGGRAVRPSTHPLRPRGAGLVYYDTTSTLFECD